MNTSALMGVKQESSLQILDSIDMLGILEGTDRYRMTKIKGING